MFGLTVDKLIVIGIIAAVLIGPKQLPVYAERLGVLVRTLRDLVETTKARAVEEFGSEFDATEWKRLDPRQFDPRRIVQEALAEEPVVTKEVVSGTPAVAAGGWQAALLERVERAERDGADAHRAPAPSSDAPVTDADADAASASGRAS